VGYLTLVATFTASTVAFGTTPPLLSRTVPIRSPLMTCDCVVPTTSRLSTKTARPTKATIPLKPYLISPPGFTNVIPSNRRVQPLGKYTTTLHAAFVLTAILLTTLFCVRYKTMTNRRARQSRSKIRSNIVPMKIGINYSGFPQHYPELFGIASLSADKIQGKLLGWRRRCKQPNDGDSPRVPHAFRQGSRALSRDFHESRVPRDLVQQWQRALGLRQDSFDHVILELQQGIVHAEPVILDAPIQQVDQLLLARQSLANLQQLCRLCVQRVVELHFVRFARRLPAKRLFPQVRDLPVHIQIQPFEMVQLPGQFENLRAQPRANLKRCRSRVFVQLPDFIAGIPGALRNLDLDELRHAGLEHPPVRKDIARRQATAGVAAAHRHSRSEKITTLRRSKLMGLSRCRRRGGLLRDPPAHPADWFLVNRMPRVARRSAVAT